MTPELLGVLGYVAVSLVIGLIVGRHVANEDDYLLAGRRLGPVLATFSVFATWFGAETCLGAAGAIYADGLSGGSADPFGYAGTLLLMGAVFALPLHRRGLTTVADLFRRRYGAAAERVAALLMVPTSVLWAAAQVRAFGHVLSVSSGASIGAMVTLAAVLAIVYTSVGGLLADAVTDVVQGVALLVGLLVLAWAVSGEVDGVQAGLTAQPPERLALLGGPEASWWDVAEAWAVPICGSVLAQELVSRTLAARSPGVARGAALGGGVLYLVIGLVPAWLGLVGSEVMPGLADPEELLPRLARQHLSVGLYILFSGALVSAILSTVDSALLAASAVLTHNIVAPALGRLDAADRLRVARLGTVACGLVAWGLALSAESVFGLVEEASAFGSAGIFVVATAALFVPWGGPRAALGGLSAGLAAWVVGAYVLALDTPYLASLTAAALGFLGLGLTERDAPGLVREAA